MKSILQTICQLQASKQSGNSTHLIKRCNALCDGCILFIQLCTSPGYKSLQRFPSLNNIMWQFQHPRIKPWRVFKFGFKCKITSYESEWQLKSGSSVILFRFAMHKQNWIVYKLPSSSMKNRNNARFLGKVFLFPQQWKICFVENPYKCCSATLDLIKCRFSFPRLHFYF